MGYFIGLFIMCVGAGRFIGSGGCVWVSSFRGSMVCLAITYTCFSVRGG